MALLSFSLTPEATGRIFELLTCLAKFGDVVSLEARSKKLTLTALNSSRTAYASFTLDANAFFISYNFNIIPSTSGGDRFTFQLYNKALQSVFKGRTADGRGRETAIDQCDITIQDDPDKTECRLVVKMLSKHGVFFFGGGGTSGLIDPILGMTKTYRLTYESVEVMHALFDRTAATQGWRISSRVLREYVEYFGPKTEQLDLVAEDGNAVFTSFTEKIQDGKEVLRQPLETAISIHTEDFEDFHVQEKMHVVISVKDFRAIVTHAETLKGPISAYFSYPTRPLQFNYQNSGMYCEFTLMTTGDFRGASSEREPNFISTRSSPRQPSAVPAPAPGLSREPSEMPPPARTIAKKPLSSQSQRPSLREQARTTSEEEDPDPDSLFVPNIGGEEDQGWDPTNYEDDEMLGWDVSNDNMSASMRVTIRDVNTTQTRVRDIPNGKPSQEGLEPTQRLSELHGMFD